MPRKTKKKAPKIEAWRKERLKLIKRLVERRKVSALARELLAGLKKPSEDEDS